MLILEIILLTYGRLLLLLLLFVITIAMWLQQNPAKRKYQIHLKSHSGPIYVLLVNKDSDGSSPVVVQVPPPREDMDVDITEPAAENRPNTSRKVAKVVLHIS